MALFQKIQEDMIAALKEQSRQKLGALRMLKAALQNRKIAQQRELSDDDVIAIVMSEIKKRNDAIVLYLQGGRLERAEEEKAEISYLEAYLPVQMSEEELRKIVKDAIAHTGAKSAKERGKVMVVVMPFIKGRATGDAVSRIVQELLG